MSLQTSYFGKRPAESLNRRPDGSMGGASSSAAAASAQTTAAPIDSPALSGAPTKEGGSKLTVGPNIKLKGVEITDCDTLVVEGTVEATMDSRVMHITELGAFKGSADIDFAEIHGQFHGDLTVRQKLVIYATGRVTGKIRYGKVIIEEGGQLMGDIQFGASKVAGLAVSAPAASSTSASAPVLRPQAAVV
jgi:cytoskeletal protein CcmA (bactofilin family)